MIPEKELKELEKKKNKLEKKDIDLVISDFDDTIFSTKKLIDRDYRKWRRWAEWNTFIVENNLIDKIIDEIYKGVKYPKDISSKLRKNHDLILTVWIDEFQIKKIKATWLDYINNVIVDTAEKKIIETIKYVVNNLKFIPNKITIFEDRPKYFLENKDFIEKFLWTKLEIMFVEMTSNNKEPKIKKID